MIDLVTRLRAEGESPVTGTNARVAGWAMRAFDTDRGMRAAFTILRHRHQAACSLPRPSRKSRLRFLELRKSKPRPLGIAPFLPGRSRSKSSSRNGPYRGTARADGRTPRIRRLPGSAPSAGAAAARDRGQPAGKHDAFEQVVGDASSGSKPLSLDPVGQLRRAFIGHEIGDYRYFLQHFEAASRTAGRSFGSTPRAKL